MTEGKLTFWYEFVKRSVIANQHIFGLFMFVALIWHIVNLNIREGISYPFLKDPQMEDGDEFFVKTPDGRYLAACGGCLPNKNLTTRCSHYVCARKYPYRTSVFIWRQHDDRRFSVETVFGGYWKRCTGCVEFCNDVICADGVNRNLRLCKFELIKNRNGTVSFRNDMGRMLELCPCGGNESSDGSSDGECGKLLCSLGVRQENAEFIIEKLPKRSPDPTLQFVKLKPDFVKQQDPRFLGVSLSNLA